MSNTFIFFWLAIRTCSIVIMASSQRSPARAMCGVSPLSESGSIIDDIPVRSFV